MLLYRYFFIFTICLSVFYGCAANHQKPATVPESTPSEIEAPGHEANAPVKAQEIISSDQNGISTTNSWNNSTKVSVAGETEQAEDSSLETDQPGSIKKDTPEEDAIDTETQSDLDRALEFCRAAQDLWQKGELDNALIALDEAYALIINVDTNDNPKLIQQKEDLRFLISKRILEIYASRNIVVNGNHHAIPLTINHHVQKEIDRFTKGRDKKFFIESYRRSGKFRPYIEKKLKEAGMPESLTWLPLIESGFKTGALSRARALGLWQFISSTGYKFGLKRDMYIDERLDPVKSTRAAIEYLKALHNIFGDWTTALAAYNCGEGRVLRIIRNQRVNYLDNFWDLYERLPLETARYVPKFLATLHIIKNLEKYGLDSIKPDQPLSFETIEISRRVTLKQIANKTGMPLNTLIELNPELRHKMLPPEPYNLRVLPGKKELLVATINEIPVSSQPRHSFVYHRVKRGQTLSTIAERYRTSVKSITRANNIHRKNLIVAGKLLKIPVRSSYRPVYLHASNHKVRRGDSLWNIARRY
ncbi:MAG: transglycosylase SLT domain-containing protein, partial [Deltaproteobacteria bacterium]|nr:transglycosylase SLT domain-containing protein [Deltaproteobacteria bacterium]